MRTPRLTAAALVLVGLAAGACSTSDQATGPRAATGALGAVRAPRFYAGSQNGLTLYYLACRSGETRSASGVIGRDGGKIRAGGFAVDFPAGAVAAPTTFTIAASAGGTLRFDARAEGAAHYTFAKPVRVTLDLSACGSLPEGLHAYFVDGATGDLRENMGGEVDRGVRALHFSTGHFSGYTVVWGRTGDTPPDTSETGGGGSDSTGTGSTRTTGN